MPEYDVFISFNRADSPITARIADALESAGVSVWMDRERLEHGERWDEEITRAIDSAASVLVIISPESHDSRWLHEEIVHAIDRKKVIIPVLVGDTQISDIPPRLKNIQFLDLRNPVAFGQAMSDLIESLRIHPSVSTKEPEPAVAPPAEPELKPAPPPAPAPVIRPAEIDSEDEEDVAFGDVEFAPPPEPQPQEAPESAKKREARREREEAEFSAPSEISTGDQDYDYLMLTNEELKEKIRERNIQGKPTYQLRSEYERRLKGEDVNIWQSQSISESDLASSSAQPPQFTAYYPEAVKPASPYALMIFVHLDAARAQVEEIAQGYAPMMGGSQASAGVASAVKVGVGSLITFVPVVEGITFDAAERVVTWQPPYQSATFLFTTPQNLPAALTGRVLVYQGPLIIGEIPIQIQVVAADQPISTTPNKATDMDRLQPVFASYSHRDTPVMEYFRRSYARLGQKMLVDVYDLRSGEHWADRLLEMIGESAVFQLFWSDHSAQSKYCRQEWEHALHYINERPRFIRPVWWQEPMPAPPPELADLHFQRVPIPALTRMQVIMARVRGFFS